MATITEIIKNIKNNNKPQVVTLVTHKSTSRFHADEVSSTALLRILFEKLFVKTKLVQTFNPAQEGYTDKTPDCIVYDIGLGMYDHHQPDGQNQHCLREDPDGVIRKYSSVGLIWKEIAKELVPEEYIEDIYNNLIKYIDDNDNGFESNPLSYCIRNMNVPPNKGHDSGNAFECAALAMQLFFENIFDTVWAKKEEEDEISTLINAAKTNNIKFVISDKYLDGMIAACAKEEIPFYIYPSSRGDNCYCFRTITPVGGEMNEHLVDIPQEVRNWDGVTFLHPSGFLGSAVTKARAIEIIETILDSNK